MALSTHTSWYDDDGDLTEMSDSEAEDEEAIPPSPPVPPPRPAPPVPASTRPKPTRPSTQSATEKSRARNGSKASTPCLRPYRTVTYSASALHDWLEQGLVNLEAEYQRGIVWNETKQMNLIDSLFHNFYIPPIVFAVERRQDGSEHRICIDGKQRLTSIHRFSKGEIAHKDSTTNRKSYFINPPGSKRKLITSQMQANFKNKQLACVEYEDLTPEQEREIFQRVQLGVTLAPADRLPAINGPYADLVRRLRNRIYTTAGFETYLEWGKARGKDFQALAQIVYLIAHGHQPRKAEPQTSRLEAFLAMGGDDTAAMEENAYNVMDIFCRIVSDRELGRPLHHKLSPLELVMSGYLIHVHRKKLSDTQLSDAIEYMRMDIKKSVPEPKFNTQNFKQLLNFVLKEVPKLFSRLKKGPAGEMPAFQVPYAAAPARSAKESSVGFESSASSSDIVDKPVKTSTKRKRPVPPEKDDSDSDFVRPKKAPRKSESNVAITRNETPSVNGPSCSAPTGARLALLKQPGASNNSSPARTTVKGKKGPTKPLQASTSNLSTPPVSAARSSVPTANAKSGTQVAKPSVKPSSAARTPAGPPLASNSSTSNPVPQTSAPLPKPPLPGRRPLPATTSTISPVEQDFHLPSAPTGTALPKAASLFDPTVQVTRAEDLGQDAGGPAPQHLNTLLPAAPAASSSSLSSSSRRPSATTSMNKLPSNIKFNKTKSAPEQAPIPDSPSLNEARWQAGADALLNSIGAGPNSRPSQPPPPSTVTHVPPLVRARIRQASPSSSSPMISQRVLAPQPPTSWNPGDGVHNPGQPLTPMPTPSPTFPYSQPGASSAALPSPSLAASSRFSPTDNGRPVPTGPKGTSSSSNSVNESSTIDPRVARMNAQAQLLAAHEARNAQQTQSHHATPPMLTPPMSSTFPPWAEDAPMDAPKRPRAVREARQPWQAGLGYESVDGDDQQQQPAAKRGRSSSGRQDS